MKAEDYGLHVNYKQKCSTRAQTQSGQQNLKSIDTRALNYSKFHIGGTETSCFLLLWQPEGQAQQHVHSVQLCCTAQLQQSLYNVLLLSVVTCLFTTIATQVEDEFPVEGTPSHNENNGCCNSRACSWKRQCLYNQAVPALFMQV